MKRHTVGYHDILTRLLDLPALTTGERRAVAAALHAGDPDRVADRARQLLAALAADGRLLRSVREDGPGRRRVIYGSLDGFTSFSLPDAALPDAVAAEAVPPPADGPLVLQRPCTTHLSIDAESLRALLSLQGRVVSRGNRLLAGPSEALMHALIAARRIVDADHAALQLLRPPSAGAGDLQPQLPPVPLALAREVEQVLGENVVMSLPDLSTHAGGAESKYRSVALVPVGGENLAVSGVLSLWSTRPAHFTPERLGLLDMLAEVTTDLLAKSEALGQLVFTDPLTQVYNRTYFNVQIRKEIARAKREGASMVLCILDLDDFKRLNEAPYGYEGANQVLRQIADVLRRQVRPFDCVARWGGEEYAVLLAAPMNRRDAAAICERLRRAVDGTPFTLTGLDGQSHRLHVTLCAGVAVYPQDGLTADELWRRANEALLEAKHGTKNVVVFWHEGLQPHPGERPELSSPDPIDMTPPGAAPDIVIPPPGAPPSPTAGPRGEDEPR